MEETCLAGRELIQSGLADAQNAAAAAQPEIAIIILDDLDDGVRPQALPGGEGGYSPVKPVAQPCSSGANPDRTLAIRIERANRLAGQVRDR